MTLFQKSLLICISLLVTACAPSSLRSPKAIDGQIVSQVNAEQILGPWAVTGANRASQELTNVSVLFPNKTGLRYTNTIQKGTQAETQQTEFFTWNFDASQQLLTQKIYERHIYHPGKARIVDRKNLTKKFHTELYQSKDRINTAKLSNDHETRIYSKLDDRKLEVLLKDNINVPTLIR